MTKKLAVVFGIVFVLVGILGFFNNPVVSSANTSAIFLTDAVHNIVHLLVGIVLLIAASMGSRSSALWFKIFGVVYVILFIDGLVEKDMLVGFIHQNMNDTWLHLVLGLVLLGAGFLGRDRHSMMMNQTTM
jgi:hypothetical protein